MGGPAKARGKTLTSLRNGMNLLARWSAVDVFALDAMARYTTGGRNE